MRRPSTPDEREARAAEMRGLRFGLDETMLTDAPLLDVLASAITSDPSNYSAGVEVLEQATDELASITKLVQGCDPESAVLLDVIDIFPLLHGIGKRLKVGLALLAREHARGFDVADGKDEAAGG